MLGQYRRSIANKTLLTLSLRVATVLILTTILAYWHVVSIITDKSLEQLETQISERGQREREIFKLAADNHSALKAEILRRLSDMGDRDPKARFDSLVQRFPDGTIRTRLEGFDGDREPFIFIGRDVPVDADIRRRVVTFLGLSKEFGPAWRHRLQNVYFTMPENILVGYWPDVPDWAHEASPDLYIPKEEYFWVADRKHDPERKTVWTGLFYDAPSRTWMVSAETPVEFEGRHIATIGHDITLNKLFERTINDHIHGAYNIIFRDDGRLIAHPRLMEAIKKHDGNFDIRHFGDANLKRIYRAVMENTPGKHVLDNAADDEYLATASIPEAGWHLVTVYPKRLVSQAAWSTARIVLFLGLLSLIAELIVVFFVLRKNVAMPLARLVDRTNRIASGDYGISQKSSTDDEFGSLTRSFDEMSEAVEIRTRELEESSNRLQAAMNTMAQGISVFSAEGRLLSYNGKYSEMFEFPPGFLRPGMHTEQIIRFRADRGDFGPGDPAAATRERVERFNKPHKSTPQERRLANGLVYLYQREKMPDGGWVHSYTDITYRERAEQKLQQRERFLSGIMQNAADGLVTISENGIIESFNPAAEKMFGYSAEEVIGRNVSILMSESDGAQHDAHILNYRAGKQSKIIGAGSRELIAIRKDRSRFPVEISVDEMFLDDRRLFIGDMRDITARKEAERQIFEKSALLEKTLEHMGHGFSVFDGDGRLLAFNQKFIDLYAFPPGFIHVGLEHTELIRYLVEKGLIGDKGSSIDAMVRRRVESAQRGEPRYNESVLPNGTHYAYLRVPLPDGGFVATYTDISDRKTAEHEAAQKSALLERTIEAMAQGFVVYDAELRLVAFNSQFERLFGFPDNFLRPGLPIEEIIRNRRIKWVDQHDRPEEERIRRHVERAKQPLSRVQERELTDGTVYVYHRTPLAGGGFITTYTDITERKRAEREIAEKSNLLEATFQNMSQGIGVYNADHDLIAFNRQYGEILGLPPDYLRTGMSRRDIIRHRLEMDHYGGGELEQTLDEKISRAAEPESSDRMLPDGRSYSYERRPTPDGGYISTVTDITERREAERQLQQAQKMEVVGQLTGGIAHDFNNILAISLGNVELAQEAARAGRDVGSFLETIRKSTERGASLTAQLLAFSRKQTLFPENINAGDLVAGMTDMVRRTLGETIEVRVSGDAGLWQCKVDPVQLESAILNLAINARDAMPAGGRLTIETLNANLEDPYAAAQAEIEPGEYVLIAVSDTGTGMSREVIEHAFDPFFTTKEVGRGSGLGLSMVYGFVKQSNGHVTIYSEQDRGTTIKLYLPRAGQPQGGSAQVVQDDIPEARGETVLVVEDDPDVRTLSVALLSSFGYEILEAADGASALKLCARAPKIDLLFTDVVLPGGMSGLDLAKQVRTVFPGIAVLYTSGYTELSNFSSELHSDGELLKKPYRKVDLAKKVRMALDREMV